MLPLGLYPLQHRSPLEGQARTPPVRSGRERMRRAGGDDGVGYRAAHHRDHQGFVLRRHILPGDSTRLPCFVAALRRQPFITLVEVPGDGFRQIPWSHDALLSISGTPTVAVEKHAALEALWRTPTGSTRGRTRDCNPGPFFEFNFEFGFLLYARIGRLSLFLSPRFSPWHSS